MDREVNIIDVAGLKRERVDQFGRLISAKEKREPVLIMNRSGAYKFTRREEAEKMEKANLAIILTPADKDYVKGTKMALGVQEGVKPGDFIQSRGKYVAVEDIGKFDVESVIKESQEVVAEYIEKEAKGLLKPQEMPKDQDMFAGRIRRRNFFRES